MGAHPQTEMKSAHFSLADFACRCCDTAAAAARSLGAQIDRRKAAPPRLGRIFKNQERDTELPELFGAAWSLVFGFWLLLPLHSFDNTKAFRVLQAVGPEWLWGLAMAVLGLWRIDAIAMNRTGARHNLTMWHVVLCSFLSVLFLVGNFTSPAGAFFALVAALEALNYRNQFLEVD